MIVSSANPAQSHASLAPDDRSAWVARYRAVRAFSEELCQPLEIEDYVVQSMPDASPAKWHLAHTSWFFDTFILQPEGLGIGTQHPGYEYLFNSYYNAVGPMHCRPKRGLISRPTVAETFQYRRQVDDAMCELMDSVAGASWLSVRPILELGLNHEQQHQELLLTDLKHLFAQNPLRPIYRAFCRGSTPKVSPPLAWISFPEALYWIGHEGDGFCFDNENPRHREFVPAFQLASRLATNREFMDFIEEGGYERPELWLSLGWITVKENGWTAPLYWERQLEGWHTYTLCGFLPLVPDEPVS